MVGARAHVAVPSPPTTTTTTPNGIPSAILPRRILFHSPMNAPPPSSSSAFCLTPLNDPPPALLNADGDGDGDRAPKSQPKLAQHHSHHAQALHSMPVQRIGAGLSNLGNTCFLNSVLQCLTYTPPLAAYLQAGLHKGSCRVAGFCAMCTLESHVKQALSAPGRVISPNYLVKNLRCISRSFQMWRQEDAHEYMRYLIEALQKCCPMEASAGGSLSSHKSFIQKIFGGRLRSQVKCTQCSHCSNTYDPFLDLSLEIVRAESLSKALARFTAVEVLDGDNKYQCGTCKKKVRALKQFTIDHAPHVLTVQLKRFSSSGGFGGKIDKKVHFDRTLDLKPFVNTGEEGQLKYSLYAVLVHSGWSTHSGHYYCFVRTAMDMWHVLDDSRVSQVSEKTVLEQKAYILFYTRDMNVLAASNGNHHGKRNRDTAFVVKAQGNNSSCSVKALANGTTSNAVKAQGNNSSCLAKAQANGTTSNAVKAQVNNISSMSSNRHVNGDKGASSVAKVQVNGTSNISSNSDRDVPHLVEVQANGTLSMNGVSGMTASAPAKASRLVPAEVVLKAIPGNGSGISDSPWLAGKITKMNGSSHLVIEGNRSMELVCSTDTKNIDIEGTMQQKLGGEAASHDDSSFRLSHNGKKLGSDVEMKYKENSSILLPNAATPTLRNTSFETAVPRWSDVEECKGSALEARILPNETQAHCGHVLDEWDEEYDRGKRKKVRNRMAAQQTLQEDSEGFHKHKKRKKMREEGSALLPNSEGCHHGNLFQAVAGSKSQGEVHLARLKKHKTRQGTFGHKLFLKRHRFKQLGRTPQHRRKR